MEFNEEQILRYSRNIALKELGGIGQKKLFSSSVLVCGAGGLGSPVLAYLAAAGVGRLGIIDNDQVHLSNLNRQILHNTKKLGESKVKSAKTFINNLNPDIKIDIYDEKITIDNVLEIFSNYDCVVDCLDTLLLKFLLNDACIESDKPLMHAGVVSFSGQFMPVVPGKSACLRCIFPETPGCNIGPSCSQAGILGSCAGLLGTLQATETVKYLAGLPVSYNKLLFYDGISTTFKSVDIEKKDNCPVCSKGKMLPSEEYDITRVCSD